MEHKRLGKARAPSSGSEDEADSDKEGKAQPVNTAQKDGFTSNMLLNIVGYTTRSLYEHVQHIVLLGGEFAKVISCWLSSSNEQMNIVYQSPPHMRHQHQ